MQPPLLMMACILVTSLTLGGCTNPTEHPETAYGGRACDFADNLGKALPCTPNVETTPEDAPAWPEYECVGAQRVFDMAFEWLRPSRLAPPGSPQLLGLPNGTQFPGQVLLVASYDGELELLEWPSTKEPHWIRLPVGANGRVTLFLSFIETGWADPSETAPLHVAHAARPYEGSTDYWNIWTVVSTGEDHALAVSAMAFIDGKIVTAPLNTTLWVDGYESLVATRLWTNVVMGEYYLQGNAENRECSMRYTPVPRASGSTPMDQLALGPTDARPSGMRNNGTIA